MAGIRQKPLSNGRYQGWYNDQAGKRVFFTGTKKKSETKRIAQQLDDEHRMVRLGFRPAFSAGSKNADRSFRVVVEEYLAWGDDQGGRAGRPWGRTHARERRNKLAYWEEKLGLKTLDDLKGCLPRVEAALRDLRSAGRSGRQSGLAGKTVANYAETIHSFCSWAMKRDYINENPLAAMASFDTTPVSQRRALMPEEIGRLIAAAPEHRKILYEVAIKTGLRARELRSLTPLSVDINREALILNPVFTKNRKGGLQPITLELALRLQEFGERGVARQLYDHHYGRSDAKMVDVPPEPLLFVPTHPSRELRRDLEEAGISFNVPGEGKVDFHALRATFITLVINSGASVKAVQELARHSTPVLTMNLYAKLNPEELSALAKRVDIVVPSREKCAKCVHQEDSDVTTDATNSSVGKELVASPEWWRRRDSKTIPCNNLALHIPCTSTTQSLQILAYQYVGYGRYPRQITNPLHFHYT